MDAETKRGPGRPRSTTPAQLERVRQRVAAGEALKSALAAEGVGPRTWYREVARAKAVDVVAPISVHFIDWGGHE